MLPRSSFSCSSRAAMFCDRSDIPRSAAWNSSGVLRIRPDSVSRLSASWSVSIRSEVSASPLNASTTSYGAAVRSTGITAPSSSCPSPAGSRARNIAPRRVLTLIAAPVVDPKSTSFSTVNSTFTWSPSSPTDCTLPTRTPATRTSSLALSPPASVKAA